MTVYLRAVQFLNEVAEPDYRDAVHNIESLRHAYHFCVSLFSLRDWVYEEFSKQPGWTLGNKGAFQKYLQAQCPEFAIVSDVANSAKHLRLTTPVGGKTGGIAGADHVALYGGAGERAAGR
jgi:hypothetical protein